MLDPIKKQSQIWKDLELEVFEAMEVSPAAKRSEPYKVFKWQSGGGRNIKLGWSIYQRGGFPNIRRLVQTKKKEKGKEKKQME